MQDGQTIAYGASDDLIEVDGAVREEFNPTLDGTTHYLAFSTGVVLSIRYNDDGVWAIRKVAGDDALVEIRQSTGADDGQRDDDGVPDYSDKATLLGVQWVVFGTELVRGAAAALEPSTPEVQRVRTDAGWHGRVLGANGEPVWTTEVLESPANVGAAYGVLARAAHVGVIDVDER